MSSPDNRTEGNHRLTKLPLHFETIEDSVLEVEECNAIARMIAGWLIQQAEEKLKKGGSRD